MYTDRVRRLHVGFEASCFEADTWRFRVSRTTENFGFLAHIHIFILYTGGLRA